MSLVNFFNGQTKTLKPRVIIRFKKIVKKDLKKKRASNSKIYKKDLELLLVKENVEFAE